jgi:hypothetical protein
MTPLHPTEPPARRHPRTAIAAGAAALALLAGACTEDADWAAPSLGEAVARVDAASADAPPTGSTPPSWLFVLTAPTATTAVDEGSVTVSLSRPEHVLAFTDRPARDAHFVRSDWLAEHWRELFSADPPNAVLTAQGDDGRAIEAAVEVLALDGDDSRLVATVVGIDGGPVQLPAEISRVQLFVDDTIVPVTDADWPFHSVITTPETEKYVPRAGLDPSAVDADDIYSMPAVALIEDFQVHHAPPPTTAPSG